MKREEAKNIVINYALGQKINNGINTMENLIDKIFDEHEAQLKQAYAEAEHDQKNSAMSQKEALSLIKQLEDKNKEIELRELRAFRNGYNSSQKGDFGWRMAREIVAMLFWKYKKAKANYGVLAQDAMKNGFKTAHVMLKDNYEA